MSYFRGHIYVNGLAVRTVDNTLGRDAGALASLMKKIGQDKQAIALVEQYEHLEGFSDAYHRFKNETSGLGSDDQMESEDAVE